MIGTGEERGSSNAEINGRYTYFGDMCDSRMCILPMYECVMERALVVS